jgi:hypothetical protein
MATKLQFGQRATSAKPAATTTAAPAAPAKKTPARTTAAKPEPVIDAQATVVDTPAPAAKAGLTKAPAPETTTALARPTHAPAVEGLEGELDASDIRLPRLNIVNGNSKLHTDDDYPIGAFVVEKELQIAGKDEELTLVVLNIAKSFQQKIEWGGDEMPLRFRTKEEVEANGGTTKWSKEAVDAGEYYQPRADMVLAILAPEGLDESELHRFPEELGDSKWGRFIFTVAGGGYQSMAIPVITAALGKLKTRGGLAAGVFTVKAVKKSGNGNTWVVPQAKFDQLVDDPDQLAFFQSLIAESVPVHDEE